MREIKVKCLGCGSLEGGSFCGSCHTVLPIEQEDLDFFRLFGLEARPALDGEALKDRFLALSQKLHPDRNTGADDATRLNVLSISAQLNRGYTTLANLKERLRYLVGQHTRQEPQEARQVPAEIMELFFEAHDLMQEAEALIGTHKPAASRIVAALSATDTRHADLIARIRAMKRRGEERAAAVEAEVQELDVRWMAGERDGVVTRLSALADVLSYLTRLANSLTEKELALRQ